MNKQQAAEALDEVLGGPCLGCPFCGELPGEGNVILADDREYYQIECISCGVNVEVAEDDREQAVRVWNTRAALQSVIEAGEKPLSAQGMVMVPVEPTDEMIDAAFDATC